ncbi:MAG: phosphoribosylanthranilate isomerase [Gammaproteobacteria bacterium]|nr:phosphoribosylanthranilate isomerase [Gammaproteobacteria bacterium]
MTQTRVKICGLRQADDAVFAAQAGADAIGLVFYPPSPRAVDIATAADIARALPPFVSCVGLFVNATAVDIEQVLSQVPLTLLQFHGNETPEFCNQFQLPWIKAIRMRSDINLHQQRQCYSQAQGLLLDAYKPGVPGGTGDHFDWQRIPSDIASEVVLAGGLDVHNVQQAIDQVKPWAIDVSGGVESHKGIKDRAKISAFMGQAKPYLTE